MDLSTTYLGLTLKNPVVASASPLSRSLDNLKRLEDAGVSAIVMYSLFEELIVREQVAVFRHTETHAHSYGEAMSFFPSAERFRHGPEEYLEHIRIRGLPHRILPWAPVLCVSRRSIGQPHAASPSSSLGMLQTQNTTG